MYKQSSKDIFKVLPSIVGAYMNGNMRVSAVELGKLHNVNYRTLNVSLQKLVHAGILHSQTGGKNPGYGFSHNPQDVSLYDISLVVCHIEYPRCTLKEYTDGDECMVCEIIRSAINLVIKDLKSVSCYDFYMSLKEKMNL